MDYFWKSEKIKDINNNWLTINAVPITKLIAISESLNLANTIIQKYHQLNFDELLTISDFQVLIDEILGFYQLTRSRFDILTIKELITVTIPKVNDLLATEKTEPNNDEKSMTLYEYEAKTITGLVNMGLATNLIEANAIADSYPHDKLRSYLNARLLQLDPEFEKKQEQKVTEKQLFEELKEDLATGSLFSETESFKTGLKQAMGL